MRSRRPFTSLFESAGKRQAKGARQARKDTADVLGQTAEWTDAQRKDPKSAYGLQDSALESASGFYDPSKIGSVANLYTGKAWDAAGGMAPDWAAANVGAVRDQRLAALDGLGAIASGENSISRLQADRMMNQAAGAESSMLASAPVWDPAAFRAAVGAGSDARAQIANESALAMEQERRNAAALQLGALGEQQQFDLARQQGTADIARSQAGLYSDMGQQLSDREALMQEAKRKAMQQRLDAWAQMQQLALAPYGMSLGVAPTYAGQAQADSNARRGRRARGWLKSVGSR
jgi:hypothetical protein